MTRTLLMIAGASLVLATVCLGGAAALGWNGVRHHHWADKNWNINIDDDHGVSVVSHDDGAAGGASATRDLAWSGGDRLDVDLAGDVHYVQAPGPAKLQVTGPQAAISHVVVSGSHLGFEGDGDLGGPIKVTLTAPDVRRFALAGSGDLTIDGYDQDLLDVSVSGSGNVNARGKAKAVKLDISGESDADLSEIVADSAEAQISGSGKAKIAPTAAADLSISGDGEIDLKTHPAKVTSHVSGDGKIVEGGDVVAKSD